MDEVTTLETARSEGSGGAGGNPVNRFYSVLLRPQTYLNLAYLWVGFALGIAYFVGLVTAISAAGGLSVTLVGIPLLIGVMYLWCVVAEFERVFTNVMLGAGINPLPFGNEHGNYWEWQRIKARLGNGMTWRSLVVLFVRFPVGIVGFVISVTAISIPVAMIAMPVLAVLPGGGVDFGIWHVDTAAKGLLFVLPGILLLPVAFYLTNLVAAISGQLTAAIFGPATVPEGPAVAVDRAAAAAISWRGLSLGRTMSDTTASRQSLQLKLYGAHVVVFATISIALVLINGMATPDTWWAIWPIWALAMLFGAHTGYLLRGLFGLHAGLFSVVMVGLFVIDATYSGLNWFFYPLLAWGALLILHGYGGRAIAAAAGDRARLRTPGEAGKAGPLAMAAAGSASAAGERPVATNGAAGETPDCSDDGNGGGEPTTTYDPGHAPAITVDVMMRVVTVGGRQVELTPKEFDLLALFAQNPGRPFSRDDLLDRIWKNDYEVTDRTIDTHVQRLRKKLGDQSDAIQTVWGVGYRFQAL